jgi:prepilin-type processing-associated H-X9-DG protein
LVELLVILAVIALLMSILGPTLRRAHTLTEQIVCASNMRELANAWLSYANANEGLICGGWTRCSWDWIWWQNDQDDARRAIERGALWQYTSKNVRVYHCPSDTSEHRWTYAISAVMNGEHTRYIRYTQIIDPTTTMMMMEEDDYRGYNMNSWMTNFSGDRWIDYVVGWHEAGANVAFSDAHVEHWVWEDPRSYTWRTFGKTQPGPDLRRLQKAYYPQ